MGYPAQKTSVAALVALLCDLKGYARREGKDTYYYYKPVVALLNHKLVREACPEGIARKTEEIARNNSVYVAERDLHLDPLTEAIFSSGEEKVTVYLLRVLDRLGRSEAGERAEPVEREFIFSIYTQIQHLQEMCSRRRASSRRRSSTRSWSGRWWAAFPSLFRGNRWRGCR